MLSIESNAIRLGRRLGDLGDRTVRRATVFALNDTAADILSATQKGMKDKFDRPTRFTQNAFMVWRAKPGDAEPYAEVRERPSVGKRHYLKVQEAGGRRPLTGLEKAIAAALPGREVRAVVPTRFAKTDRSGNWARAEKRKVVQAVQQGGAGPLFVAQGAKAGVYMRLGIGQGVRKIAHFASDDPSYKPLLGFFEGGETVWQSEYARHYRRIFERLSKRSGR